jgi:hypothetical protein
MNITYEEFKSYASRCQSINDMSATERKSIKAAEKIARYVDEEEETAFDVFRNLTPTSPFLETFTMFYNDPKTPALDCLGQKLRRRMNVIR